MEQRRGGMEGAEGAEQSKGGFECRMVVVFWVVVVVGVVWRGVSTAANASSRCRWHRRIAGAARRQEQEQEGGLCVRSIKWLDTVDGELSCARPSDRIVH